MRNYQTFATIAILGACLGLAACGQKGSLYLPNQKKKVPTTQAPPDTPAQPGTQAQPNTQVQPNSPSR
jgi:predicted small lipoprotein YifL